MQEMNSFAKRVYNQGIFMANNQVKIVTPEKFLPTAANQGILLFQNDSCIYQDPKIYSILGHTRNHINSIPTHQLVDQLVYHDDQKTVHSIVDDFHHVKPKKKTVKIRIMTNRHQVKWVEVVVKQISFNHQPTIQILVTDINKQKNTETQLEQSEITYRTIFDTTASGIILSDADMIIKYCNRRFCQIVGKSKKEIEGKLSWPQFMSGKDRSKMVRYHYWRRNKSHKAPRNYEFEIVDKNGQIRPCLATVTMIPRTQVSVASFLDISERIRGEFAVKQSKRRFKSAFDNAPLGIFLIDKHGVIEQANKTFLKILGLSKKQIIGQKVSTLAALQQIPKEFKKLCCIREEHSLPEVHFTTINGKELWLQIICSQISQFENNSTWMGMIQDVTDTVIAKKLVIDLPNRILQAHEEEKQTLSQEIHDAFSQSLAALKMSIQAVTAKQAAHTNRADLNEILSQVDDLINLSRSLAHNLRPEIIDKLGLIAAIHNLTKEMSQRIGFSIQMKTNVKNIPLPPSIAVQLFRIVQEAIINSIKHSQASAISVMINKRDGHLTLVVRDNGKGFNSKQIDRQLIHKRSLGLKIMNERAIKIGATCTIKSVVGQGTVISINYPMRHLITKENNFR